MTTEPTEQTSVTTDYRESVEEAMTALDEEHPGWWSEDFHWDDGEKRPIDLYRLDTADPYACVLGQLFGDYANADWELCRLAGFGGDIEVGSREHLQLAAVWREEITARRRATWVPMAEIPAWATKAEIPSIIVHIEEGPGEAS